MSESLSLGQLLVQWKGRTMESRLLGPPMAHLLEQKKAHVWAQQMLLDWWMDMAWGDACQHSYWN